MKILKMLGIVVAVHVVAFSLIYLPGCQSTVRTSPSANSGANANPNESRVEAARHQTTVAQGSAYTPSSNAPSNTTGYTQTQPASGLAYTSNNANSDFGTAYQPVQPTNYVYPNATVGTTTTSNVAQPTGADAIALPAEAAQTTAVTTYTIASGDNLSTIAKKNGITTSQLKAANPNIKPERLQIGQKIVIPAKNAAKTAVAAAPGTYVYKVKANDSIASIAQRNNTTVDRIQSLNKLTGTSIRIDQELLLPFNDAASVSTATTPDSTVASVASTTTTTTRAPATTIVHAVKSGESLDTIARYYGASRNEIATTNHITDPRKLQIGQKLTINSATKNTANATLAPATTASTQTTGATGTTATGNPVSLTTPISTQPVTTSTTSANIEYSPISPISPTNENPTSLLPTNSSTTAPVYTPPVNPIEESTPFGAPQN